MSNDPKELLSALMDGELDRDQARFLIRRLGSDAELAACWQRWHLGADCLRGTAPRVLGSDFAEAITRSIAAEPAPASRGGTVWLRWSGGAALAASVALAALLVTSPGIAPEASRSATTDLAATDPLMPVASEVAPSPLRASDLRPARVDAMPVALTDTPGATTLRLDPRIEAYLVRHNEAASVQGMGFVSYVPLVTPLRERAAVTPSEQDR